MESDNSKLKIIIFLGIILAFLLLPKISWAATYYVSHTGNATWAASTNRSTPTFWLRAIDNAVPGDRVIFVNDGGTFDEDTSGIIGGGGSQKAKSGTPGNYITYEGEAGTTVIISNNRQQLINLDGLSYIKIKNFTITSPASYGIALLNGAHHITIEGCILNAKGWGNGTWAFIYGTGANNNIIIRNNIINGDPVWGGELAVNGDFFGGGSSWTFNEDSWTISSGAINKDADGTGTLAQSMGISATGEEYKITMNVTNFTAGTFAVSIGGSNAQTVDSTGGATQSIVLYFWTTIAADFVITPSITSHFTLDNISVTQAGRTDADLIYFVNTGLTQEYILIEGNTFNYGGSHGSIDIQAGSKTTRNIVIRNNTIENPRHTALNIYGFPSNVLVENNIIKNAGSICGLNSCYENGLGSARDRSWGRDDKPGIQFMATDAIVRHNRIYKNGIGIQLGPSSNTTQRNRFYNNTFYKNCKGIDIPNWGWDITDNVFLNNIFKDNNETSVHTNYPIYFSLQSSANYAVEFGYNLSDEANNSYYRDPTRSKTGTFSQLDANPGGTIWHNNIMGAALMTDPANHDFTLQPGSPAINAGGPLTTVHTTDTGTGVSLKVKDAKFFQDGSWGPVGEVSADWIAVGSPNNITQISSIDYSTNTITLTSGISRNVGDKVWLYKNSSGQQVLYGSASDIGAYEYVEAAPPPDTTPPAAPSGVTVQ